MVRLPRLRGLVAVLMTLAIAGSALVPLTTVVSSTQAGGPTAPLLHDDFTHDVSLNSSLWQINGPVGTVFGPEDVGFNIITLKPAFSSAGMEIAQINASQEVGTIQSVQSFTAPLTVSATVEGTVSNGHTFGFAITSADATSGVLVYGNLNPTNCSHLGDCGDPSVCGNSASSSIPPNQCYYGIDAKVGNGTAWPHQAKMFLMPVTNVTYTIEISVDASGSAQYVISQGGQVLGQSTAQVGAGPFYVIMEQGEGSPVAHPGPNQAYWKSISLSPVATTLTTTLTATTPTGQPGPSPGLTPVDWVIIVLALAALLFIIFLFYFRRRGFTVKVQDSRTRAPIPKANVTADGPENLADVTNKEGMVKFGEVKEGDYSVKSIAAGYHPSTPATVKVKKRTEFIIRLDWVGRATQEGGGGRPPSAGPGPVEAPGRGESGQRAVEPVAVPSPSLPPQHPLTGVAQRSAEAQPSQVPPPPSQQGREDFEGFGGDRIRQIIKTFQTKGALSPETALTAEELGLSRLFVRIMKRRKGRTTIFMEINGRYYLNQDALKEK